MANNNAPIIKQPNYILYDQKEREALLSQMGTFTGPEREIFHKLCKMWTSNISYNYVVSLLGAESATAKTDLTNLLEKLKHQKIGLIQTKITEGVRAPENILMCEKDDVAFYAAMLDESLLDLVGDLSLPLPSFASFEEKHYTIPQNLAKETDFTKLAQLYLDKTEGNPELLKITLSDGTKLLIPSNSIKRYITICLGKLQAYFNNGNFAALMAQLRSTGLMELKKQLGSKDPSFWLELASFIESMQKEIMAQRKIGADPQLFVLCIFLKAFLSAQQDEAKARREKEQERQTDMKVLAEKVKTSLTMVISEQEFAQALVALKQKYPDTFQAFKDDFTKAFLDNPQGKNLPVIARLANILIHQDNISPWFSTAIAKVSRDLLSQYVNAMTVFIKHPDEPGFQFLYSPSALEDDILDKIKAQNLPLREMLERPNLVAEAMIHSSRKGKEPKSSDDYKSILSVYFYTDRIRFRNPSSILNINVQDIFKLAFLKISLIRQIFLKLSGRYESILKKFSGFIPDSDAFATSKQGQKEARKAQNQERETVAEPRKRKPSKDSKSSSSPSTVAKPLPKEKNYSDHEKNEAWSQFSKTLKK